MTQIGKSIGPSIKISLMTCLDHGAFKWDTLTEWSKLLLILERTCRRDGFCLVLKSYLKMQLKWDGMKKMRGFIMALHQMVMFADKDKYFWVQAETIAAAALLAHSD